MTLYRFVHAKCTPDTVHVIHSYLSVDDRFETALYGVVNKTDTAPRYKNEIDRQTPDKSFC